MATRRQMIKIVAGASVLAIAPGLNTRSRAQETKKHVIVVGAGLSGLVAAYELRKLGHRVSILEAQERTGGRVLTLRNQFDESLYADAGAARISDEHDLTIGYATEFGLELERFYPDDGLYRQGSKLLDAQSYVQAVKRYRGVDLGSIGKWLKIKGGNDLLPGAFAASLEEDIRLNAPVTSISQDERTVKVRFRSGDSQEELVGDYVVCSVPFSVISNIEFEPKLSKYKRKAIKRSKKYTPATRTFSIFTERYWERESNGFAVTKNAEFWPATHNQPGESGICQIYTWADVARRIAGMSEKKRARDALKRIGRVLPNGEGFYRETVTKAWSNDPWAKGGWISGNKLSVQKLAEPDGRIYFVGEHISNYRAWMQGALQSGKNAVRGILSTA